MCNHNHMCLLFKEKFRIRTLKSFHSLFFSRFHSYAADSCSLSWGSPGDPDSPHRSSSSWTVQCWVNEPLSGHLPALPDLPHISASILPGPLVEIFQDQINLAFSMLNNTRLLLEVNIISQKDFFFYLVKVPLFLVKVCSQTIGSLHINHEVLHLTLESLFGLLQRCTFGVHSLNLFLCLLQTLSQLLPVK